MGFLKGNVTFQRFRIAGPKPRLFADEHLDRLREHRALSTSAITSEIACRWAGGSHVLDSEFDLAKNVYPDHLLFDFWTQTDKLPTDRLKAYYEADLKALCKNNPSGKPSARQKREAKESARDRLGDEAKDGRFRKWKCVPVAWDSVTNTAFLGATSATVAERFQSLWEKTFCASETQTPLAGELSPVTASSLAIAINPTAENVTLSEFVPGRPLDTPSWCPVEGQPNFLGNEFLLWLWFQSDFYTDTLKLTDGTEAVFMFSGGVKVEDPAGQTGHGTLNSMSAVKLPEAKAAVRSGKLPRKAAFTVVRNTEQFDFILQAETLAVSSAKLPAADADESQRDRDAARLQHLRDLAETVDQMFATFLARRLSNAWDGELKEMQGWLKGGKVKA